MVRVSVGAAAVILVLGACASDDEQAGCGIPPASETTTHSDLEMRVEPRVLTAGAEAVLSLDDAGLPTDAVGGAGAEWQCWMGDRWQATHQLVRGFAGDARTIGVEPGATTSIPAVGLPLPSSYPILVPDVEPGIYRIHDVVFANGGTIDGFLVVEVS